MMLRSIFLLGSILFTTAAVAADERPASRPPDKWRAWAVTTGKETRLTVEGVYSQGGPGVVAVVTPAMPQGINPKILMLEVKVGTLPGVWPAVLSPIPASYFKTPYAAGTYDSIRIRYPDGSTIAIDKIIDGGNGPKQP